VPCFLVIGHILKLVLQPRGSFVPRVSKFCLQSSILTCVSYNEHNPTNSSINSAMCTEFHDVFLFDIRTIQ
jgi:hypothetical protein